MTDVLIAGAGPAALILGHACAARGLSVLCVDPRPDRPWPNNYGLWLDELQPLGLDRFAEIVWPQARFTMDAERVHLIDRPYARLNKDALRDHVSGGVQIEAGEVTSLMVESGRAVMRLADGRTFEGGLGVDAAGHRGHFTARVDEREPGFQAAYGVVADLAAPLETRVADLMDFSPIPGALDDAPLTFLYTLPLSSTRVFFEETVLVGRPPTDFAVLKSLLKLRLAARGITLGQVHEVEHCLIPMGVSPPHHGAILAFGGAASMVHPATGYMIHHVLRSAPDVADAIAASFAAGADAATVAAAGWSALWPRQKRRLWQMFGFGMEVLLSLEPEGVRSFFDGFFKVPPARWQAYMAGTGTMGQLSGTMLQVFNKVPVGLKGRLMSQSLTGHGARMWGALMGLG
ncbi:MAG: lycopene cyclase family protein [Bradymonadia bacterium]